MVLYFIYILNMEKIKINCPEGYEVDKDKSTFEEIVFKVKIPEYVECINETTSYLIKGRVYKCSPKMSGKHYVLTCNLKCGGYEVGSILYAEIYDVKPSTKEAFDEQNKPKFKEGDWVVVTDAIKQSAWSSRDEAVGYIFQLIQGTCEYTHPFEIEIDRLNKSGTICCPDNKYLINYKKEWLRLATPEEIAKVTKPKFEIGKWYKGGEWIFKYDGEEDGKIFHDFACTPDDGFVDPKGYFNATSSFIKEAVLLTDLSEIQKYLPDGHEDKIIKYTLEEGEYYKVVDDDFWMIGKAAKGGIEKSSVNTKDEYMDLRSNYFYSINSSKEFKVPNGLDYWCYYSEHEGEITRNFTKLSKDSEEVKWLEICNKAGKYLTKEEALKPKLPTKWEEVSHYSGCLTDGICYSTMQIRPSITNMVAWPTREYAKASIALCKLIRLRDTYNGDWKPNWQSYGEYKYVIYYFNDMIQIDSVATTKVLLHFKTRELRDEFLKNFKELIEEAKLLL